MNNLKQILLHVLFLAMVAGFSSCSSEDDPAPVTTPDVDDPVTVSITPDASYTTNRFEVGDTISISVEVTAPDTIQIYGVQRVINGGAATDVVVTPNPATNATTFSATYSFPVTEAVDDSVTLIFRAKDDDTNTFTTANYVYRVAAQGQGGGGGAFPLLRSKVTVSLGAQASSTGSYLNTALGATGVFTNTEAGALTANEQQAIDITFGVTDANNMAATGANATKPVLISPGARDGANFNNPLGANATNTSFLAETLTSLDNVTSAAVENNIDGSDGSRTAIQEIAQGSVYSFVNAAGAKGYVLVSSITGIQDNRVAQMEVLVQIIQ